MYLLSDEVIVAISKTFYDKYSDKLTASEVMELHRSEYWETILKAQLAKCEPLIRADERRKIGEWLEYEAIYETESGWLISFNEIDNLKRGKKMTYEEWKLKLIELIVNETRIKGTVRQVLTWKWDEINCVLQDDYKQGFEDGATPEDIWEGEMDAIYDSQ